MFQYLAISTNEHFFVLFTRFHNWWTSLLLPMLTQGRFPARWEHSFVFYPVHNVNLWIFCEQELYDEQQFQLFYHSFGWKARKTRHTERRTELGQILTAWRLNNSSLDLKDRYGLRGISSICPCQLVSSKNNKTSVTKENANKIETLPHTLLSITMDYNGWNDDLLNAQSAWNWRRPIIIWIIGVLGTGIFKLALKLLDSLKSLSNFINYSV